MPKKINIKGPIISNEEQWIYDWYEIEATSPSSVINELPTDGSEIEIYINSPGGSVNAGSEIYTALKEYTGHKVGKITAMAASAAGFLAMGVDELQISPTAQFMLHNVASGTWGDYRDLQHTADVLKNFNKSIANAYQLKTGKEEAELLEMMDNETWLTAQQAVEHGFADKIMFQEGAPQLVASLQNGMLPPNVIDKMRNMKDKLIKPVEPNDPIASLEEQKQNLLMELDLI